MIIYKNPKRSFEMLMLTYERCGIVVCVFVCMCELSLVCVFWYMKLIYYYFLSLHFIYVHDCCASNVRHKFPFTSILFLRLSILDYYVCFFFFIASFAIGYVSILDCVCQEDAFDLSIKSHVIAIQRLKINSLFRN